MAGAIPASPSWTFSACHDNLVYHCDLFQGIEVGLLSPFRYLGVPDEVDYAQIPWRSNQFDPEALEAALATEARARNALDQFHRHRDGPAIGFCCSVRHAEFMAAFFQAQGLRAVAVHSGPGSAPRATSLDRLGRGEIDILIAVDMFNEGVDVPNIGTVMMLRPTESVILWLQQLGRGLRRVEGKLLRVIDYIGNHRVFLTKLRALLAAGPGDRSLALRLEQAAAGTLALPPGCSVTYDLRVIEILRDLLRPKSGMEDLEAQYRDFRLRHGQRPTAAEIAHMGFDPARNGHGGWFDFVRDMGDPTRQPDRPNAGRNRARRARPPLCPLREAQKRQGGSVSLLRPARVPRLGRRKADYRHLAPAGGSAPAPVARVGHHLRRLIRCRALTTHCWRSPNGAERSGPRLRRRILPSR